MIPGSIETDAITTVAGFQPSLCAATTPWIMNFGVAKRTSVSAPDALSFAIWDETSESVYSYGSDAMIFGPFPAIARTNAPEITKGALSIAFLKNPNDPVWARDAARSLYLQILQKYAPSAKPSDVYNWYGMTAAWTMVETLKRAGRNLTRAGLVKTAQNLDLRKNPFLLPGITIRTSPTNSFPIANIYLYRYDNKEWVRASPLQPAR